MPSWWRRLRYRSIQLGLPTADGWQRGDDAPPDAIRPLGPLALGGRTHPALFLHPPSSVSLTLELDSGGICEVPVGLLPEGRQAAAAGFAIQLTTTRTRSGRRSERSLSLRPDDAGTWKTVSLDIPPPADGDDGGVEFTLASAINPSGNSAWAWTVCGAPLLSRPRTQAELRTAAQAARARAQAIGWRATLRESWRGPSPAADAPDYASWLATHEHHDPDAERAAQAQWSSRPLVSVITPAYNTRPDWLRACYDSLTAQSYPHWEWCVADDASTNPETAIALTALSDDARVRTVRLAANGGISRASNAALALATGEIIVLLDHDDALTPSALHHIVDAFVTHPDLGLLYSDEDKLEIDGSRTEPYFKPDWSPELFLSTMYACHVSAAHRTLIEAAGGFHEGFEGAQDYDLWLRMTELTTKVHHVRRVLYHWRKVPGSTAAAQSEKPWASDAGQRALSAAISRRGWRATVEPGATAGRYRVRHEVRDQLTSILIPTYGAQSASTAHTRRVATMVRSIVATVPGRRIEFICATEDGSIPGDVRAAAGAHPMTVVAVPGAFNFSARINHAARRAQGHVLLLANDDLEAREAGWLDALLEYAQQDEIGAVGGLLEYPDGRIQHAGLILGVRGVASHAFHEAPGGTAGYFGCVISPRNVSAVTAACLATRRSVFEAVGGFDEALPVDFNDVDYCLKVQRDGLRVVYTPYARLRHHEGASLGTRHPDQAARQLMESRWAAALAHDPYYHPLLSRDAVDYRLAW
jgi:GT2 family glycosyltransferase